MFPFNGATQVDTLSTYAELKNYQGNRDSVYLSHHRYFGLFTQSECDDEDYGTNVITFFRGCWTRSFVNYSPRFWEIGGLSKDGQIPMVRTEADAINSAALAAFEAGGGIIEIDSMYPVKKQINLFTNNTYLGTSDSSGFYREIPPKTILTTNIGVGDNKIYVLDNAGFETFQKINIASAQAYDSLAGHVSYTASIPQNDTTILLSGRTIRKEMEAGDSVSLFYSMMGPGTSSLGNVFLKNLVFHGNRKDYSLSYDWRVNTTLSIPTTESSLIEKCRFYEIPAENIFLCGAMVIDCSGDSFNGSALHFSCNRDSIFTEVMYNQFSKLNEVGDEIMSHSEGGLTFSAKVRNLRVAYNEVNGSREAGIGRFDRNDYNNEITDNLISSDSDPIKFIGFYEGENLIYNNKQGNNLMAFEQRFTVASKPVDLYSCQGTSSMDEPLSIGDTITIVLDTLEVTRPNENFVKCLIPVYDDRYFHLANMEIRTDSLSIHHSWVFDRDTGICEGLVFDNGHREGLYGKGNWGYDGCSSKGGCTEIAISFVVHSLPSCEPIVNCPLEGIQISYDGDLNTWAHPPEVPQETLFFDSAALGLPFLSQTSGDSESDFLASVCPGQAIIINDNHFDQPGDYQMVLQNKAGCDSVVNIQIVELSAGDTKCLPLNASGADDVVNLFPNPANDWLHIESQKVIEKIRLFSITGQLERSYLLDDRFDININLSQLSSGVKVIVISFEDGQHARLRVLKK